jgi:ABC-type spermidine/putrescine transport system permease subunit I
MIAMLIERAAEITVDWPQASILSLFLLGVTLLLYAIYFKITDVRRLMGA